MKLIMKDREERIIQAGYANVNYDVSTGDYGITSLGFAVEESSPVGEKHSIGKMIDATNEAKLPIANFLKQLFEDSNGDREVYIESVFRKKWDYTNADSTACYTFGVMTICTPAGNFQ